MNFRIEEALLYPFKNWITCILIPGLVVYIDLIFVTALLIFAFLIIALMLAIGVGGLASMTDLQDIAPLQIAENGVRMLGQLDLGELLRADDDSRYSGGGLGNPTSIGQRWGGPLYLIFWMGFEWQLFARWQREGFDTPAPDFETGFLGWFKDGLKGSVFYIPLNIVLFTPMIIAITLAVLSLAPHFKSSTPPESALITAGLLIFGTLIVYGLLGFFLGPFLIAPMIHSAQNRSIRELFDIRKAIDITLPRYPQILVAFLLIMALWMAYTLVTLVLALVTCCVGLLLFPFIWEGAFRVSAAHLIAQAFDYQPAIAQTAGAPPPPSGDNLPGAA